MPGDTVTIYYTGKFLTGKVFDTNIESDATNAKLTASTFNPLRFTLGNPGMIKGWNEAIQLLNAGSKATLILPSSLAYGEQGSPKVPGLTPLVFNVELVNISRPNKNTSGAAISK